MIVDEEWARVARESREALELLGRPLPRCLPGEADECGATFAQHAAAHLATIKAVADHQLWHLGPGFSQVHGDVYWNERRTLETACAAECERTCQ